jgi:hypothetical protein
MLLLQQGSCWHIYFGISALEVAPVVVERVGGRGYVSFHRQRFAHACGVGRFHV